MREERLNANFIGLNVVICGAPMTGKTTAAASLTLLSSRENPVGFLGVSAREEAKMYPAMPEVHIHTPRGLYNVLTKYVENITLLPKRLLNDRNIPKLFVVFDEWYGIPTQFNLNGPLLGTKNVTSVICCQVYPPPEVLSGEEWVPDRILFTHPAAIELYAESRPGTRVPTEAFDVCCRRRHYLSFDPAARKWSEVIPA